MVGPVTINIGGKEVFISHVRDSRFEFELIPLSSKEDEPLKFRVYYEKAAENPVLVPRPFS